MLPVKKKYCFAKELRVCAPVLEVPTTVDPNPDDLKCDLKKI